MTIVAVYGTLKQGFGNHHLLVTADYLGKGTTGAGFNMVQTGFPVLLDTFAGYPVAVEVYRVSPRQLAQLDRLEGNGRMYQRRRVRLRDSDGKPWHRAWVYVGIDAFWMNQSVDDVRPSPRYDRGAVYDWRGYAS